ncbi:hypothetical protein JZ751_016979 [Albula glossodonta]|uniref:ATP synthase peripheral stalk subunit F6, mitochondrial n=1 Tax=Albula glossodonta TaxID=121402 RepID=A0A8T2MQK6_9TELE|nr:hypothetical protein JZ751_016979 [Albula glossodonta]
MAASLLRIVGRLGSLKGLQLESWSYLRRVPVSALCTKSGDPKNFKTKKPSLKNAKAKTSLNIAQLLQSRAIGDLPKEAASAKTDAKPAAATAESAAPPPAPEPAAAAACNTGDLLVLRPLPLSRCSAHLDPIQKLFLDKIREYSAKSQTSGGLVDAGPEYEKTLSEEVTRLQRLYGGSDLTHFPEFQFPEPKLEEAAAK